MKTNKMIRNVTVLSTAIIGALCLAPNGARAEREKTGNGGIAAVCRENGIAKRAYLLDLMEAEQRDHLAIQYSNVSYGQQLDEAQNRIPGIRGKMKFRRIKDGAVIEYLTNPAFALPDSGDFHPRVSMVGCPFEAVALYNDQTENLTIDESVFKVMSPTHRAALLAHEFIYRAARRIGDQSSDQSRLMVGQLFAINSDPVQLANYTDIQVLAATAVHCNIGALSGGWWFNDTGNYFPDTEGRLYVGSVKTPKGRSLNFWVMLDEVAGLDVFATQGAFIDRQTSLGESSGDESAALRMSIGNGESLSISCQYR